MLSKWRQKDKFHEKKYIRKFRNRFQYHLPTFQFFTSNYISSASFWLLMIAAIVTSENNLRIIPRRMKSQVTLSFIWQCQIKKANVRFSKQRENRYSFRFRTESVSKKLTAEGWIDWNEMFKMRKMNRKNNLYGFLFHGFTVQKHTCSTIFIANLIISNRGFTIATSQNTGSYACVRRILFCTCAMLHHIRIFIFCKCSFFCLLPVTDNSLKHVLRRNSLHFSKSWKQWHSRLKFPKFSVEDS